MPQFNCQGMSDPRVLYYPSTRQTARMKHRFRSTYTVAWCGLIHDEAGGAKRSGRVRLGVWSFGRQWLSFRWLLEACALHLFDKRHTRNAESSCGFGLVLSRARQNVDQYFAFERGNLLSK
jgi:hypothetical protein